LKTVADETNKSLATKHSNQDFTHWQDTLAANSSCRLINRTKVATHIRRRLSSAQSLTGDFISTRIPAKLQVPRSLLEMLVSLVSFQSYSSIVVKIGGERRRVLVIP
jgi:hypothetical protein